MGGQVLGGGVIVLVAVVLWMLYLLPSWQGRYRYNAAERNAVRLGQALRVLAETSETPDEVRVELNARAALAQQRIARKAVAEREHAERDVVRAEADAARLKARTDAAAAKEIALAEAERAAEQSRVETARVAQKALAEAHIARTSPEARRARARSRARILTLVIAALAVGLAVWGAIDVVTTGSQVLLWSAVALAVGCGLLLRRMSLVGARAAVQAEGLALPRTAGPLQDVALESDPSIWTPRELPRPLTASAGSRAAAVLDQAAAREALRQAAIEETMRQKAEEALPPSIAVARADRATAAASLHHTDDAGIEDHVRRLLERRAVGQ